MRFSRFESFSVASSFPTVWIVENTQQPNSFLRSHWFPSWLAEDKSPFKILGFEVHGAYHQALRWLPLCSLLFDKTYPFLLSPLCFRTIVLEKWNLVQQYTLNVVFLVAATSSNTNRKHFLRTQSKDKWNYVDFTEIARNRFGIDVNSSTLPDCCFTRTWTKMASF